MTDSELVQDLLLELRRKAWSGARIASDHQHEALSSMLLESANIKNEQANVIVELWSYAIDTGF